MQGHAETRGPNYPRHICSGLPRSGGEGLRESCIAHGTVTGTEVKCGMNMEIHVKCICMFKLFTSVLFIKAIVENNSNSGSRGMIKDKYSASSPWYWLFKMSLR